MEPALGKRREEEDHRKGRTIINALNVLLPGKDVSHTIREFGVGSP